MDNDKFILEPKIENILKESKEEILKENNSKLDGFHARSESISENLEKSAGDFQSAIKKLNSVQEEFDAVYNKIDKDLDSFLVSIKKILIFGIIFSVCIIASLLIVTMNKIQDFQGELSLTSQLNTILVSQLDSSIVSQEEISDQLTTLSQSGVELRIEELQTEVSLITTQLNSIGIAQIETSLMGIDSSLSDLDSLLHTEIERLNLTFRDETSKNDSILHYEIDELESDLYSKIDYEIDELESDLYSKFDLLTGIFNEWLDSQEAEEGSI